MNVLVVEDEPKVAAFLKKGLQEEGWQVRAEADGLQALKSIDSYPLDVIVLDLMIPGLDGLSVLKEMRDRGIDTPVLILTARDTVPDRVKGLNHGADDYLIKPFAFEELLARLQALVRRRVKRADDILKVADLEMDVQRHVVRRSGREIKLTALEFRLLELLLRNAGRVLDRLEIEDKIWDENDFRTTNVINVYIRHLRAKIDDPFQTPLIKTVRGFGYKIEAPDEE